MTIFCNAVVVFLLLTTSTRAASFGWLSDVAVQEQAEEPKLDLSISNLGKTIPTDVAVEYGGEYSEYLLSRPLRVFGR
jgi:hypothetical protein